VLLEGFQWWGVCWAGKGVGHHVQLAGDVLDAGGELGDEGEVSLLT
jgi:hypothetical protein